jgi:hypothetical protein
MFRRIWLGLIVACLITAWIPGSSTATIVPENAFPIQNETIRLTLTDDDGNAVEGATVIVTYRPGSSVEMTEPLGITDSEGTVTWTPSSAGLATVTATWQDMEQAEQTESKTVPVRYQRAPWSGIVIMIIAGLVLAVGSVIRVFRLLRSEEVS